MRKVLVVILVMVLLCGSVCAYEVPQDFSGMTLDQIMTDFMDYYELDESNFSISFYNTVTGESYNFNENKFAIAASTYKLPLNMYFYEMEQAGQIKSDETFLWTGMTLSEVHRQSVLFSNNEVSEAMAGYWNNYYVYKENMRKYSSMPVEMIDQSYYLTNSSCTRMMMDTLKYLYANDEKFDELIGYMKEAVPGEYFKAGVQEYEIAHKYGAVNEFINDVGIIYAPQPILLAVYTQGIYGSGVCAQAARLMTDYTVWKMDRSGDIAVSTELNVEKQNDPVENVPSEPTPEEAPVATEELPAKEEKPVEQQKPVKVEETKPEEIPTEEKEPAQTQAEEAQEETPQPEMDEEQIAAKERRNEIVLWTVIAAVSVISLAAIPFLLRKRY